MNFTGMQAEAKRTKAEGDFRVLQTAIEAYHKDKGVYPPVSVPSKSYQDWLLESSPKILGSKVYDPFAGRNTEYKYYLSQDGQFYLISSLGPDITNGIAVNGNALSVNGDDLYVSNGWRTNAQ